MAQAATQTSGALARALWPVSEGQGNAAIRAVVLAVLGSALLAISAQIQVPFWPVPLTMQTFVVLGVGLTYGSGIGAATLVLYLLEGLSGLPVFAGASAGPAVFTGPTGGYLIGFVFAAGIVGRLAEEGWDRSPVKAIAAMVLGNLIIYLCGVAWLTLVIAGSKGLEPLAAFPIALGFGVYPFLLGDALKILLATSLLWGAWRMVGARGEK
jgi:biotin transport system substrate-specific component